MNTISKRQHAHLYIYIKQKKEKRLYIYTQKSRHFCVFIHRNSDTLRYVIFHEIFEIDIYIYTKSLTLCIM